MVRTLKEKEKDDKKAMMVEMKKIKEIKNKLEEERKEIKLKIESNEEILLLKNLIKKESVSKQIPLAQHAPPE